MLKVGDIAPDFILKNHEGREVRLSHFRGKYIVLFFYPKDNTFGCTRECVHFTKYEKDFESLNCVVLGVSPDSLESHIAFRIAHNINVNLLSDTEKNTIKRYGVWQNKVAYGKQFEGVVRSTFLIDSEGKIVSIWSDVTVEGHVEKVKDKLKELINIAPFRQKRLG